MTDDPRAAAFDLVLQARNDADEKYLACYAELVRVTKERDDANREAEFQHARAAKFADMLKAAPPAEGPTWQQGSWPNGVHRAFVDGAKWWDWVKAGATMWASDRDLAEAEAVKRYGPLPTPPRDPAGKE